MSEAPTDVMDVDTPPPDAKPDAAPDAKPDAKPDDPPKGDGKAIIDDKPKDIVDLDGAPKTGDKDDQAGDGLSDDADAGEEGAPDKYTFEAPEGVDVDQGALDQFSELAKDLDLSQEAYQKIVEYDLKRSQEANDAAVAEWNSRVQSWKDASKTDKEIGGDDFAESTQLAQSSINQFADDDFRALMKSPTADNPNGLALINHPAVMRFLTRVGKVIADPSIITGDAATPSEEAHDRLYPTMRSK